MSSFKMSSSPIYTPLSGPDTIRVLEIGLVRRPAGDHLSGRLTIESLHDQPNYVALSYVWGASSSKDPIIEIAGYPFQVRESLFQAIKVLVSDNPKGKIRLWIDQICINQNDNTEKEHQVQLMSKIYSQARLVVCWLGDEADASDFAMVSFSYITRIHREAPKLSPPPRELGNANHYELISNISNPMVGKLGRACAALVQRPLFRRLWIVQEVALAKELELRCGSSSISGDEFFTAIDLLSSATTVPASATIGLIYEGALRLGQLREQSFTRPCESFPHLLQKTCTWECEKPQDRLNGLFGVAFRCDPATAWFKPSYSMSGPELFAMFAAQRVGVTGGLEILHFAGCQDSQTSMRPKGDGLLFPVPTLASHVPSWVPDWRVRRRPLPLFTNVQDNIKINFSATASKPSYSLDRISQRLHVSAIEIDRVKATSRPYHPSIGDSPAVMNNFILDWLEMAESYIDSTVVKRMFSQTLTMDLKVGIPRRGQEDLDPVTALADFERHNQGDYGVYPGDYEENWGKTIDGVTEFRYIAEELCRHRLLFITESGRLGLGGPQVEEGDLIYLIHGLRTPFVVDCNSERHRLRCECYVHGLMDGEVQCSDQDTILHLR
ncbi:hypothetical protein CEP54_000962 [Fusarium duplospermum]|uniref:Heterokaryon incompatibility domain-containing protein n=1 Tax=Fusarium duplospermum TaxID=1325734 RepID=A0A428R4J4_9HYPO|nr:hypothetical protein CEP54_000962 [Fusarium duplospermum]